MTTKERLEEMQAEIAEWKATEADIVTRYQAGEGLKSLATRSGLSLVRVQAVLKAAGVRLRNRRAANLIGRNTGRAWKSQSIYSHYPKGPHYVD